ncbi:MAG: beta-ketoacyl synthase N-terminal-like domain-containing protein [Planctomycetota bacterium]|nr:beta-ketoacyl synthase N-terminal-like domain-containing protein [Planctomycetota bacterium]
MPATPPTPRQAVVTGIGMVTPLGDSPAAVLAGIEAGRSAARAPSFDAAALLCPLAAPIDGFDPERHVDDVKSLRLMSRDAQLAVAAARMALADAGLEPRRPYAPEDIALYGATGLTGMPAEEVAALVRHSADPEGNLDLRRFGSVTLKRVRPVLSFRILANMPICFVSIAGSIRGANGIYTPWEGQGAHAIAAGIRAIEEGLAPCAVVGGCDVRTHEFAFVSLQQLGAFQSWADHGEGAVPGEGAAFLVLEEQSLAADREARVYATIPRHAIGTTSSKVPLADTLAGLVSAARPDGAARIVAAGDGDRPIRQAEADAIERAGLGAADTLYPKRHVGNLYAAAAAVQVALAAAMVERAGTGHAVLANCFGYGSQQGSFLLEAV